VVGRRVMPSMEFCRPPVVDMVGFALALTAYTVSLTLRTRPSWVFFLE
jgi:hypothetical protein